MNENAPNGKNGGKIMVTFADRVLRKRDVK